MPSFRNIVLMSDADNTLLARDHQIPKRNLDAIRYFAQEGGVFVLATGRPIHGARHIAEQLPQGMPAVYFNGALIFDHASGKPIRVDPLPPDMETVASFLVRNYPQLGVECFDLEGGWILQDGPYTQFHFRLLREAPQYLPADMLPQEGLLKMFATGESRDLEQARQELLARWLEKFHAIRSGENYLEIFSRSSSKGAAVRALRDYYLGKRKIVAVGDSFNDISMLKAADAAFMPADGEEALREITRTVCPCSQGSIADVIEILGKET